MSLMLQERWNSLQQAARVKRVVRKLAINDVACGCRPVLGIASALLCADMSWERSRDLV